MQMDKTVKIHFINNEGGGFADLIDVKEGLTLGQFFLDRFPQDGPAKFLIRVNRDIVDHGYVLKEGDRVSVTPTKVGGAFRRG